MFVSFRRQGEGAELLDLVAGVEWPACFPQASLLDILELAYWGEHGAASPFFKFYFFLSLSLSIYVFTVYLSVFVSAFVSAFEG